MGFFSSYLSAFRIDMKYRFYTWTLRHLNRLRDKVLSKLGDDEMQ